MLPDQIDSESDATSLVDWCIENIGLCYHPDASASEYVDASGLRLFQPFVATKLDRLHKEAFDAGFAEQMYDRGIVLQREAIAKKLEQRAVRWGRKAAPAPLKNGVVAKSQKRVGLGGQPEFPEYEAMATIPAVEALRAGGNSVEPVAGRRAYRIRLLGIVPAGIVAVHTNDPDCPTAIRLASEPPYPIEFPAFWATVDFTPCPVCGAALLWYEAGYVPGYRVCVKAPFHHVLVKLGE